MTVSLHQVSVPVFKQGLKGLRGVLDKAEAHVAERNLDPDALLRARLFPDMFPLIRQVQIATEFAKGSISRLAGDEVPAWEDNETSFADLKTRIDRTVAHLESFAADRIDGQEDRDVPLTRRGETTVHKAQAYLLEQAMPNFWFHVTTAYAILRHNGVEVGKRDFLGTR